MTRLLPLFLLCGLSWAQTAPPSATPQNGPKPVTVTWTIVDAKTKRPVKRANVEIQGSSQVNGKWQMDAPLSAISDDEGLARITEVVPGTYTIRVRAASHIPFSVVQKVAETPAVQNNTVSLDPSGVVEGKVLDEAGEPLAGAEVVVLQHRVEGTRLTWSAVKKTTTDDRGIYRIADLTPGRYFLRVAVSPKRGAPAAAMGYEPVYYPNAPAPQQSQRLEMKPDANLSNLDFHLRAVPTFRVRGTLTGAGASQVRGLEILSCGDRAEDPAVTIPATIQPDGTFDAAGLTRGTYCVTYREYSTNPARLVRFGQQSVRIVDQDVKEVLVKAEEPITISGIVVVEKPENPATAPKMIPSLQFVPVSKAGTLPIIAKVNPDGTFQLDGVFPIDYRPVFCSILCRVVSAKLDNIDMPQETWHGVAAQKMEIHVRYAYATLRGGIKVPQNVSKAGMWVTLVSEESPGTARIVSSASGDTGGFIDALPPGSYKIYAWEKHDIALMQLPEFMDHFTGTKIKVEEGPNKLPMDLPLISAAESDAVAATF